MYPSETRAVTAARGESSGGFAGRFAILAFAIAAVLVFALVSFWWLPCFLTNERSAPMGIDRGSAGPWIDAAAVDLALIALFGLHHSVMAREAVKRRLHRLMPEAVERSAFVLVSSLLLALVMAWWQPIPITLWKFGAGPARWASWVAFSGGWFLVVWAMIVIDPMELTGLRQAIAAFRNVGPAPAPFKEPSLYRFVRHPMQLGFLIAVWAAPHMTVGHVLFAGAMTAYVLVGLRFEERALVRRFGETYRTYQARTPMLLPWPRPAPRA